MKLNTLIWSILSNRKVLDYRRHTLFYNEIHSSVFQMKLNLFANKTQNATEKRITVDYNCPYIKRQ